MSAPNVPPLACPVVRRAIHAALDEPGRPFSASVAAHLSRCVPCRALARDLDRLGAVLADAPPLPLPDDVLEEIWRRTVGSPVADPQPNSPHRGRVPAHRRTPRRGPRVAAGIAAALTFAALVLPLFVVEPRDAVPSDAQLARAAADLQYVLRLTGGALDRGRAVALDEALYRPFKQLPWRQPARRH